MHGDFVLIYMLSDVCSRTTSQKYVRPWPSTHIRTRIQHTFFFPFMISIILLCMYMHHVPRKEKGASTEACMKREEGGFRACTSVFVSPLSVGSGNTGTVWCPAALNPPNQGAWLPLRLPPLSCLVPFHPVSTLPIYPTPYMYVVYRMHGRVYVTDKRENQRTGGGLGEELCHTT